MCSIEIHLPHPLPYVGDGPVVSESAAMDTPASGVHNAAVVVVVVDAAVVVVHLVALVVGCSMEYLPWYCQLNFAASDEEKKNNRAISEGASKKWKLSKRNAP
jgi:hypothetical protein